MMKEFCHHYDGFLGVEIRKAKAELSQVQQDFKSFFCIKNEEDTVEELLDFLIQFDQKHKEKVEKLTKARSLKISKRAKFDEGKANQP